jgi:8-oxo-dGTP diphosphatase
MPTTGADGDRPLVLVAAAALVDEESRVLVATRPERKSMAGLWEFPGGKVESGETPEACLVRELAEELGIVTRPPCLAPLSFASHAYPTFHLLMPLFVCRVWEGEPTPKEGQQIRWLRPKELFKLPMPEADRPLLRFLDELL